MTAWDLSCLRVCLGATLGLFVFTSAASAQAPTPADPADLVRAFNTRRFLPPMDAQGLAVTERAVGLETGDLNLSLMTDFAFDALSQRLVGADGVTRSAAVVDRYTSGQFTLSVGLFGRVTLALSQHLLIISGDLDGEGGAPPYSTDGAGDTHALVKVIALDSRRSPVGVALALDASFDVTGVHPLASEGGSPLLTPWLVVDSEWERVELSVNAGYVMRARGSVDAPAGDLVRLDPVSVGPELAYRAGVAVRYIPGFLHQTFEALGAVPTAGGARGVSLEAISALRLIFNQGSHLTLGAGRGLLEGYADPALRVFMMIAFQPSDPDTDEDGIPDSRDACPRAAEDRDGFEDADGCPDPDNDLDGLEDLYDQCPNEPEDKNGCEDDDGCPDQERDLDRDGIPDDRDECDLMPEDRDSYADQDGCPDPDNDSDTLADVEDKCPNDPEDFDAHQDADGCPDPDNDSDGIPDRRDSCPNEPEDKDGFEDSDGCPDGAPKPSKVKMGRGRLEVNGVVYFELNRATIKTESYELLLEIAAFINDHEEISSIEVQGHTDTRGDARKNLALSEARAAAVADFLVERGGVRASRLTSKGFGASQPIAPGSSEEAHAKNRRVEFRIPRD
jgi:OOP family OmpA-OmpF porin